MRRVSTPSESTASGRQSSGPVASPCHQENQHPLTGVVAETSKLTTESKVDNGKDVARRQMATTDSHDSYTFDSHESAKQKGLVQPLQVERSDVAIGEETTQPTGPSRVYLDETTIPKQNMRQNSTNPPISCRISKVSGDAIPISNNNTETFCEANAGCHINTTLLPTQRDDHVLGRRIQRIQDASCLKDARAPESNPTTHVGEQV